MKDVIIVTSLDIIRGIADLAGNILLFHLLGVQEVDRQIVGEIIVAEMKEEGPEVQGGIADLGQGHRGTVVVEMIEVGGEIVETDVMIEKMVIGITDETDVTPKSKREIKVEAQLVIRRQRATTTKLNNQIKIWIPKRPQTMIEMTDYSV